MRMEINATEAWLGGRIMVVVPLFYSLHLFNKTREWSHEMELNLSKKCSLFSFFGVSKSENKKESKNKTEWNNILHACKHKYRDESTINETIVTEMHGKTFSHGTETKFCRLFGIALFCIHFHCACACVELNTFISLLLSLSIILWLRVSVFVCVWCCCFLFSYRYPYGPVKLLMNTLIILLEISVKWDAVGASAAAAAAVSRCWSEWKAKMRCVCVRTCAHILPMNWVCMAKR